MSKPANHGPRCSTPKHNHKTYPSTHPARRAPEGRAPEVVAGVHGARPVLVVPGGGAAAEGAGRDHLGAGERETGHRGTGRRQRELLDAEDKAADNGAVAVGGGEGEGGVTPAVVRLWGSGLWVRARRWYVSTHTHTFRALTRRG